jgi:hypothetical protein
MAKIVKSSENSTGRNTKFEISRAELVRQIEKNIHPELHIRVINGVKTPCSNPNNNLKDNLG